MFCKIFLIAAVLAFAAAEPKPGFLGAAVAPIAAPLAAPIAAPIATSYAAAPALTYGAGFYGAPAYGYSGLYRSYGLGASYGYPLGRSVIY